MFEMNRKDAMTFRTLPLKGLVGVTYYYDFIQLKVLGTKESPLAILWYASTNFYGTIIDSTIKGLRIRQGNILIGNNMTCAQFFKEERFNGWVIGEIHVLHDGLIANSRRDNFEQNEPYFELAEEIRECAALITKELRKLVAKKRLITEIGKYVLLQNLEYTDYTGTEPVEIGKIVDSFSKEDVMYIYYNKNNYKETGYHINIDVYVGDKGEFPVANTDDLHRACIYDQPDVFLAMMLHEYGHYKNGDLNRQDLTNKSIQDDRLHCIRIGRVQDTERKADAFAVRYVGKAAFLKSIDYMILKRMQRNEDPSVTALAIREFELRKRAVKNM